MLIKNIMSLLRSNMSPTFFNSQEGAVIPAVNEYQMREVDRIAVEDFGLGILQMMENAGRTLALNIIEMLGKGTRTEITIAAGTGGNGGGGICCARHLHNHGFSVSLLLTKNTSDYKGPVQTQLEPLLKSGVYPHPPEDARIAISQAEIVVDALIGYGLKFAPRGTTAKYIELINEYAKRVISLDLPSGIDATTGETPGLHIRAERTLTLALPKSGLTNRVSGEIFLADIGIPPEVFHSLGIHFDPFFGELYYIRLIPNR
jgi:NAD(P)H-hydrate epimerase